jgi:hypothetical protein
VQFEDRPVPDHTGVRRERTAGIHQKRFACELILCQFEQRKWSVSTRWTQQFDHGRTSGVKWNKDADQARRRAWKFSSAAAGPLIK